MKIDLSGVKGPGPVPPGIYPVVITKAVEDVVQDGARNAGEPLLKLEMTVDEGEYETKRVWDNMVITHGSEDRGTKSTMWRIQQLLKAVGKDTDGEVEFDADEDILGHEIRVQVIIREGRYDPNTETTYQDSNQITKFLPREDTAPSLR